MISIKKKKKDCCGCKTCMNVCPTDSIEIKCHELGFEYPVINQLTCINCGRCKSVCPMINTDVKGKQIESVYAVVLNENAVLNSASGGAFYALAKAFIEEGGTVFGCAFNDKLMAKHIEVNKIKDLKKLQGSKYVQSDMNCHQRIKEILATGKSVLFSGTPCQVAGIKAFIGDKDENLICVEIVCHGVPNAKLWKEYIEYLESTQKGTVEGFKFRTKGNKGKFCSEYILKKNNSLKIIKLPSVLSYYYFSFLKGKTYRRSCYSCPFAQPNRQADITICDYWGYTGIKFKAYPEISAVLIQGEKGEHLFNRARHYLMVEETNFESVAINNEQLKKPSSLEKYDDELMELWKTKGARGLEAKHRREHWKAYLLNRIGLL